MSAEAFSAACCLVDSEIVAKREIAGPVEAARARGRPNP